MIFLEAVAAKSLPDLRTRRPGALATRLGFLLGRGCHALSGPGTDPALASLVLELCAGEIVPSRGKVEILGNRAGTARARREAIYVGREPPLPDDMTPLEAARLEASLRGAGKDPAARLRALGLERLAERRIATLTSPERRAVALAIAVGSSAKVLLLDEPFVQIASEAAARLAEAVRSSASAPDRAVLLATASLRDAKALGAEVHGLVGERLVPAGYPTAGEGTVLVVVASDPMRLASEIAAEGVALGVSATATSVEVHTSDPVAAAEAVARAALATSIAIVAMTTKSAGGLGPVVAPAATIGEAARKLPSLAPPPPPPPSEPLVSGGSP